MKRISIPRLNFYCFGQVAEVPVKSRICCEAEMVIILI